MIELHTAVAKFIRDNLAEFLIEGRLII